MAKGEFTKEEAEEAKDSIMELYAAIPPARRTSYRRCFDEISLFIEAAIQAAPAETERATVPDPAAAAGPAN